jgi:hypothetical protein
VVGVVRGAAAPAAVEQPAPVHVKARA